MKKPRCRVCKDACPDMEKRFDPVLGYVCPCCHGFLLYADKFLRKVGIEGIMFKPEGETP